MARKLPAKDAVVIGLGWTGSILAYELCEAGLDVAAIERGPWRDTPLDFTTRARRQQSARRWGELLKAMTGISHGANMAIAAPTAPHVGTKSAADSTDTTSEQPSAAEFARGQFMAHSPLPATTPRLLTSRLTASSGTIPPEPAYRWP